MPPLSQEKHHHLQSHPVIEGPILSSVRTEGVLYELQADSPVEGGKWVEFNIVYQNYTLYKGVVSSCSHWAGRFGQGCGHCLPLTAWVWAIT